MAGTVGGMRVSMHINTCLAVRRRRARCGKELLRRPYPNNVPTCTPLTHLQDCSHATGCLAWCTPLGCSPAFLQQLINCCSQPARSKQGTNERQIRSDHMHTDTEPILQTVPPFLTTVTTTYDYLQLEDCGTRPAGVHTCAAGQVWPRRCMVATGQAPSCSCGAGRTGGGGAWPSSRRSRHRSGHGSG